MFEALAIGAVLVALTMLWRAVRALERLEHLLRSVDAELFHVAQEQTEGYGLCSVCRRRTIVREVVPKPPAERSDLDPDVFLCHGCFWRSSKLQLAEPGKLYKDRRRRSDVAAEIAGPGSNPGW